MDERDWIDFFELLEKITNQEGTAKQKAREVVERAKQEEATTALEEFVSWYDGDASEEV